jgi:hypothetical protein
MFYSINLFPKFEFSFSNPSNEFFDLRFASYYYNNSKNAHAQGSSLSSCQWSQVTSDSNTFHAYHSAWVATVICFVLEFAFDDICIGCIAYKLKKKMQPIKLVLLCKLMHIFEYVHLECRLIYLFILLFV